MILVSGNAEPRLMHNLKECGVYATDPMHGQLFSVDDLGWLDFETFGDALDLKAAGVFRYAATPSTRAIALAYALGNGPVRVWHADGAILPGRSARRR
jgi:hypothetical protein